MWEAVHLIEGLLANDSDIQPSTVHADTQGQSAPVFTLATLFGFDLMPRIRNFQDLIFFRASAHLIYPHIDGLFGERGRNVIDWQLIQRHWRDLMQVAISISEGRLSSATLMRRLRSNSRKNRIYKVFREVGRSVRTVALLRYLADPQLRARVAAATNKAESYHGFAQRLGFGNNGVLADNDPTEQEKLIKFNTLLANLVIFHNALDIIDIVRGLVAEGWTITADQLGAGRRGQGQGVVLCRIQPRSAIMSVRNRAFGHPPAGDTLKPVPAITPVTPAGPGPGCGGTNVAAVRSSGRAGRATTTRVLLLRSWCR